MSSASETVALRREVEELKTQLRRMNLKVDRHEKEKARWMEERNKWDSERDDMETEIDILLIKTSTLEKNQNLESVDAIHVSETKKLHEQLEAAEMENAQLQKTLHTRDGDINKIQAAITEIRDIGLANLQGFIREVLDPSEDTPSMNKGKSQLAIQPPKADIPKSVTSSGPVEGVSKEPEKKMDRELKKAPVFTSSKPATRPKLAAMGFPKDVPTGPKFPGPKGKTVLKTSAANEGSKDDGWTVKAAKPKPWSVKPQVKTELVKSKESKVEVKAEGSNSSYSQVLQTKPLTDEQIMKNIVMENLIEMKINAEMRKKEENKLKEDKTREDKIRDAKTSSVGSKYHLETSNLAKVETEEAKTEFKTMDVRKEVKPLEAETEVKSEGSKVEGSKPTKPLDSQVAQPEPLTDDQIQENIAITVEEDEAKGRKLAASSVETEEVKKEVKTEEEWRKEAEEAEKIHMAKTRVSTAVSDQSVVPYELRVRIRVKEMKRKAGVLMNESEESEDDIEDEEPIYNDEFGGDESEEESTDSIGSDVEMAEEVTPKAAESELETTTSIPTSSNVGSTLKEVVPAEKALLAEEPKTGPAEPKTESAEPKTESAEPKTESAEPKTESAEPKTESAEPKTESAEESKTGSAKPMTKSAEESKTGPAESKTGPVEEPKAVPTEQMIKSKKRREKRKATQGET